MVILFYHMLFLQTLNQYKYPQNYGSFYIFHGFKTNIFKIIPKNLIYDNEIVRGINISNRKNLWLH